jgi:hypothetical protein
MKETTLSQVIVTEDHLIDRRQLTKDQEERIDTDSEFRNWQRSDVTKTDAFERLAGIVFLPIAAIWAAMTFAIWLTTKVVGGVFNLIGKLIR